MKAWQNAPWRPPERVQEGYRAGLNLGLHCGLVEGAPLQVVVVDLDSAEALAAAQLRLPPTPLRTLTSKGEHWYYRHPGPGHKVGNRIALGGIALDVRGDGGNVIVAPSVHPDDGSPYREAEEWTYEAVQAMPVFDNAWLAEQVSMSAVASARKADLLDDDRVRRAAAYLRKTPGAVQGKAGDMCTYKAAVAVVRGFAITEEGTALRLLLTEFNPRCVPPWTEAELRHKVKMARGADKPLGYLLERPSHARATVSTSWIPGSVPPGAGRWSKAPTEVLWSGLPPELIVLYLKLLSFQWDDGAIFPCASTLAGGHLSERQIRTNLDRLELLGLIVVTPRPGRTPLIECRHGKQSARRPRKPTSRVATRVAPEVQRRRPRKPTSADSE